MKKEDLKEDVVRSGLALFVSYIADNSKQFITAILLICFAIGGYGLYTASKVTKVNASMEDILAYLSTINSSQDPVSSSMKLKLNSIIDDHEKQSSGMLAFIYLLDTYYKENDLDGIARLFDNYSINFIDPLIKSSFLETQANIAINNNNTKSIEMLNQSLGVDHIYTFSIRFKISKALAYISNKQYSKAGELLNNIKDKSIVALDKNKIEELIAYCNTKY